MAHNIAYGHEHFPSHCGIQTGEVTVTPTANTVSVFEITFPEPFAEAPDIVIVSPFTTVPYTTVRYATACNYTADGFTLHLYRTNSTTTVVNWMAVGKFV